METSILTSRVAQISEEKAQLSIEMQNKLEHERQSADKLAREQMSETEDLIEKVRNLEFSLENSRTRAQDFEERYNMFRVENTRVKEEAKAAYERQR